MALIYPMNPEFKVPLDRFSFNDQLMLDVLPLDLASGRWAEDVLPGGNSYCGLEVLVCSLQSLRLISTEAV